MLKKTYSLFFSSVFKIKRCFWYKRSATGIFFSYQRSSPVLLPPKSKIAQRLGSKAYKTRYGSPACWIRNSRKCVSFEPSIPDEKGNFRFGPHCSNRLTVDAISICSPSVRLYHQSSNSSVYSTSHIITIVQ